MPAPSARSSARSCSSLVGVFLLFAINAFTYVGVILAMRAWKRPAEARAAQRRETLGEAARAGIAFVRGSAELRAIFARGLCFFVPGIAMGTLLPVIGRFELGLDEFTFGILYGVFGIGAVAAAFSLPMVNRLLGADRANIWAMGVSAAATLVAALAMTPIVVGAVVAINGACWITVIANNGASVQMILPNYMRARGMAVHQMVFFGAMVLGSLLWGKIANFFDVRTALIAVRRDAGAVHRARPPRSSCRARPCHASDMDVPRRTTSWRTNFRGGADLFLVTVSISCR